MQTPRRLEGIHAVRCARSPRSSQAGLCMSMPRCLVSMWACLELVLGRGHGLPPGGGVRPELSPALAVVLLVALSLLLTQWPQRLFTGDPVCVAGAALLLLFVAGLACVVWRQPQDATPLHFKVGSLL